MPHAHKTRRVAVRLILLATLVLFPLLPVTAAPVTDLRVLVDVSGSMKQNDPDNLRASALRLLVGLVPDKSHSGVWTFGRYVNMSVKHQPVGPAWKTAARREAGRIHSRGLYTNIEGALERAAYGWEKPDARFRRHMILLTDGMVDIDKDPKKNLASRERILQKLLPRLKSANVHIHTIGLSANADAELLQTLSRATGGWHETVSDANQLQKVFLRLFEKSTPVNTLPITGNRFDVDRNVTDMTLLVFRETGAEPASLVTPGGQTWTSKQHPGSVTWFPEKGYDLITVKGPTAGQWQIKASTDPDNRVMVLTNLRLQLGELPNSVLPGESLQINARLEQKGRTVTRRGFLNLVKFRVQHLSSQGESSPRLLKDDGKGADKQQGDGVFSTRINVTSNAMLSPGVHEFKISAKGATFERQQRHTVRVFESPATITIEKSENGHHHVSVTPAPGLMQQGSLTVTVASADGKTIPIQKTSDDHWQAEIPPPEFDMPIAIGISGQRYASERRLEMTVERVLAGAKGAAAPVEAIEMPAIEKTEPTPQMATDEEEQDTTEVAETESSDSDAHEANAGGGWVRVVMYVVAANALLVGGGLGGWWLWRRKRKPAGDDDAELDYE